MYLSNHHISHPHPSHHAVISVTLTLATWLSNLVEEKPLVSRQSNLEEPLDQHPHHSNYSHSSGHHIIKLWGATTLATLTMAPTIQSNLERQLHWPSSSQQLPYSQTLRDHYIGHPYNSNHHTVKPWEITTLATIIIAATIQSNLEGPLHWLPSSSLYQPPWLSDFCSEIDDIIHFLLLCPNIN